jgi:hypothetical protein
MGRLLSGIKVNDLKITVSQTLQIPALQTKVLPFGDRFGTHGDFDFFDANRVDSPIQNARMTTQNAKFHLLHSDANPPWDQVSYYPKLVHDENQLPPFIVEFASRQLLRHPEHPPAFQRPLHASCFQLPQKPYPPKMSIDVAAIETTHRRHSVLKRGNSEQNPPESAISPSAVQSERSPEKIFPVRRKNIPKIGN